MRYRGGTMKHQVTSRLQIVHAVELTLNVHASDANSPFEIKMQSIKIFILLAQQQGR
eukprot:m.739829 g.739829  ORF g.739829 m.739829 type:complete len:57 (-) comp23110_c0_seq5:2845-3015(-)